MKKIGISVLKILGFILLWALLTAAVIMGAVAFSGEGFYAIREMRIGVEIALTFAVLIPLIIMARLVDKRPLTTIGFGPPRVFDLLTGTIIGAAIFAVPLGVLVAIGAATYALDLSTFAADALALALITCFFNVVTQEVIVRSYIFQELWAKYGAWIATGITTALFVAMHAVREGFGSIVAPREFFPSRARWKLRCPLPDLVVRGERYLAHSTSRADPRYVGRFVDWLEEEIGR